VLGWNHKGAHVNSTALTNIAPDIFRKRLLVEGYFHSEMAESVLRPSSKPTCGGVSSISVCILEREEGEVAHFITMTSWSSLEAIKGFAGDDAERAKYYPEDQDFVLEFEPTSVPSIRRLSTLELPHTNPDGDGRNSM
jgi:hypothetical protein